MTLATRKLIGILALLAFLAAYGLAAMMAAIVLQASASKLVELAYYVAAGLLWVAPAGLIVRWMHRPPAPRDQSRR